MRVFDLSMLVLTALTMFSAVYMGINTWVPFDGEYVFERVILSLFYFYSLDRCAVVFREIRKNYLVNKLHQELFGD